MRHSDSLLDSYINSLNTFAHLSIFCFDSYLVLISHYYFLYYSLDRIQHISNITSDKKCKLIKKN